MATVYLGAAIAFLGEILHIVGLATEEWMVVDSAGAETRFGLFQACNDLLCLDYDKLKQFVPEYYKLEVTQAMIILGMIFGLITVLTAIVSAVFKSMSKSGFSMMYIVCLGTSCMACLFSIIGVIYFAVEIYQEDVKAFKDISTVTVDLGYSFALCIVGGLLLPIGGALVFHGRQREAV